MNYQSVDLFVDDNEYSELLRALINEASRGAGALVSDCKRDWLWGRSALEEFNIYLNLCFCFLVLAWRQNAVLSSPTLHAMPAEFGRKWATEYLNIKFPLPILLCAGYSVKLMYF